MDKFLSKPHFLPHFFQFGEKKPKTPAKSPTPPFSFPPKISPTKEWSVMLWVYVFSLSQLILNWYLAIWERIHIPVIRYIFPNQRGLKEFKPWQEASNLAMSLFVFFFFFFSNYNTLLTLQLEMLIAL